MKNTITRTKNTVSANYLPYAAYKSAIALTTAHKGEIGKTDKGNFMATFNSVETAKKFVAEWTAEYEANRKVEVAPTPKSIPTKKSSTSKPTATKGKKAETVTVELNGVKYTVNQADLVPTQTPKTTSSTKKTTKATATKKSTTSPTKAKGNKKSTLENFVLNNPSCTRAEALAHGFSGTKSELALLKKTLGVR